MKILLAADALCHRIEEVRKPLNKSYAGATAATRDEMREARRSEWRSLRKPSDKADRPESPVPFGFRRNAALASLRSSCLSYG